MRSAAKPRAHSSRVASTSPYTSPLLPPNFTFTSSSSPMTQANFGDRPLNFLSRYLQVTVSRNWNDPGPSGPALRSLPAILLGDHTRERSITALRGSSFLAAAWVPTVAHALAAVITKTTATRPYEFVTPHADATTLPVDWTD